MQHMSARAILHLSLVIIPAIVDAEFALEIPRDIRKSEHLIHHLVLDLQTTPHDGAHNIELYRGLQSMASLSSIFSNLVSCIFVVHLVHVNEARSNLMTLANQVLSYRKPTNISNTITLRNTFVEFTNAFLGQGPGERKSIRFAHSDVHKDQAKMVGTLVPVNKGKPSGAVSPPGASAIRENQSAADAERICKKAYMGTYRAE
jgi:hypothetical protein